MTTNTHRIAPAPERAKWKAYTLRLVSLAVVLIIGAGVYFAADRAERQDCLNRAFQASLDERAKATDDLIDALGEVNSGLRQARGALQVDTARRAFGDALARVEADREATRVATRERQEADCA